MKIETLDRLASLLQVSVAILLGVGIEVPRLRGDHLEQMRQIELTAQHVTLLASPIASHPYLASDSFESTLEEVLRESIPPDVEDRNRLLEDVTRIRPSCASGRRPTGCDGADSSPVYLVGLVAGSRARLANGIAPAITARMQPDHRTQWRRRRQRLPSGDGPDVRPRLRVVGDPRKSPAQLDSSRQLTLLAEDGADRVGVGLGDEEHPKSMATRRSSDKRGVVYLAKSGQCFCP